MSRLTPLLDRLQPVLIWLGNRIDAFAHADGPPPQTLWPFVKWCLAGAWPVILLAATLSAVAGVTEVGSAYLLGVIVDSAVAADSASSYLAENAWLLLLYVAFFLIIRPIAFGASATYNGIVLPPNIAPLIQSRLHRWSLGHSVSFFDNDFAGRIAQKQMQTASALTDVVNEIINAAAFVAATLIGSVIMLTLFDWRIGLCLVLWLGLYAWMIAWFLPRIRQRAKNRAAARANVTGQIVDTITNIKTVKLFGHTNFEDAAGIDALRGYRGRALEFGYLATGFRIALITVAGALPVVLVLTAILLWNAGQATAGEIAATGAIAMRISQMSGWASFVLMGVYANIGEIEDGMRTLTPSHDLTDAPHAKTLHQAEGRIVFDHVSFAYGREIGGIAELSLTVEPGEKLGIVGASGAGKSTLVALLLRLYDAERGRITIDGADIGALSQESLRRQIGMVTQETAMFNRSARDNILYGQPEASEDQMIAAATRAHADVFIQELEDFQGRTGYDAYLGERGVKLSGGQRQRIALARAFLKDAPVLVLDEATSALDSEVEAAIQEVLDDVMDGKTVIAIAHRLSTIARMDRIVVMDEGRIVEEGSHEALLAQDGLYARYWNRQSGGFIGVRDAAE